MWDILSSRQRQRGQTPVFSLIAFCVLTPTLTSHITRPTTPAQVAELVDALASGASVRMDVEVRVLSWAPYTLSKITKTGCYLLVPYSFR